MKKVSQASLVSGRDPNPGPSSAASQGTQQQEVGWEAEWGLEPRHCDVGRGHLNWLLTTKRSAHLDLAFRGLDGITIAGLTCGSSKGTKLLDL